MVSRYWRTDFVNDADKKRRDTEMLVPKDDQHGSERDVRIRSARQISDILNPINLRTHQSASSMAFADFMEERSRFFPYLKDKIQREKL